MKQAQNQLFTSQIFFHEIEFPQIPVSGNLLVISELVPGMFLNWIGQNFTVEVPGLLKKFMQIRYPW
ncbi:hypothetical protein MSSIT_0983 [Methanosarcina siciliae T4/M]|uniref:Uncharacterized protein n=1 Tax=Methanosarcina siciliae T4/M TaxID=1434120 RepID=A0A0E3P2I0_9EURY|nr:hypothetical protein MSSIT_0983 [Methanosarcina siciliae T4/M]